MLVNEMWSHRYLTLPSRVPHSSRQDARCLWNSMKLSSDCGREGIRTAEGSSSAAASRVKWRSQDGSRLGFHYRQLGTHQINKKGARVEVCRADLECKRLNTLSHPGELQKVPFRGVLELLRWMRVHQTNLMTRVTVSPGSCDGSSMVSLGGWKGRLFALVRRSYNIGMAVKVLKLGLNHIEQEGIRSTDLIGKSGSLSPPSTLQRSSQTVDGAITSTRLSRIHISCS
ncbi:hypothetical protein F2Q69_00048627 [Brassica cretica]|uniref:Uncharacterized protein n=1 Tax=Brassica cretica TaxID=69181 RepID=A0A8S9PLY8_BRACR|nr:hypothetical protein F2Q69_00048627 [Brassica cretica]